MFHGWLRADLRTLDTLKDVAGCIATTYINRPIGEWRNPRQQAWALKVPIAAYKSTGDPFYLLTAETIVDALLDRQDASGGWSVELRNNAASPGGMSYGTTNFPLGITLASLSRYHELTDDERVADAIVRGTRWLIEDMWEIDETIGFRYSSSPGASGGSNFYHIIYAVAYAHALAPDRTFADATLAYSDAYLTEPIGDTHEFGKPFAQRIREVVPTMPLVKSMLDTPHVGLSAGSDQQWVIKLPADETEHDLLRIVGRGEDAISADVSIRSLDGRTLMQQTVRGGGDFHVSLDVASLPTGELLELTLQPIGGETWDVQLVRGGQMLSLDGTPIVGAGGIDLGDEALSLYASASTHLGGGDLAFRWDLGDGTTIDGPRVDGHTFAADGSYDATLTATADDGSTATRSFTIRSAPPALLGDGTRVLVNAEDFVSQSRGGLLVTERINSIGEMITYWSGDEMNKLTYRFDVERPGRYVLVTKFANNSADPSRRAYWVDGEQPDAAMRNLAFPLTGGWSNFNDNWAWQTLSDDSDTPITFDLAAGEHTLEVGNTSGGLGVDYFVFQLADDIPNQEELFNGQR